MTAKDWSGSTEDAEVLAMSGRWDYSSLPSNIHLGSDCFIEMRGLVGPVQSQRDPAVIIGDRVSLYGGGWGGSMSVDEGALVEIGDDSVLVGVQFMCAHHIRVGRRVAISYNVVIADCDFHPRDPLLRRSDAVSGAPFGTWSGYAPRLTAPVAIDDDASIGLNTLILKGVRIGAGASVMAGSVVTSDVPAGAIASGNPARVVEP